MEDTNTNEKIENFIDNSTTDIEDTDAKRMLKLKPKIELLLKE